MEVHDPGPDAEEFRAIVRRYWRLARRLCEEFSIAREYRRQLYIALEDAKFMYDEVQY
jgi:hypothetical protein